METQYISLNMTPTGVNPCFHISQYDVGRILGFIVHAGGVTVDLDTYTCTVEATRSDGTAITSAVATTGNTGTFEVTPTMSNKADKYRCQLVIVDENSKRIASLPFDMEVTKAAMDENSEAIEEDASLYQQYTEAVQGAIAEANADIQAEESARIAAVSAEATARANADTAEATARANADTAEATARTAADSTLQGNINSEASTRASADSNLQSQIDQIIAPSGEAPSAAEVQNARIGADGVTYDTLGNAIRTQVSDLKSAFDSQFNETIRPFSDYSLYSGHGWGRGNLILSTTIIPAFTYIKGIRVHFNEDSTSSDAEAYVIDNTTKKVLKKARFLIRNSWQTVALNFCCTSACVIAFCGGSIKTREELVASPDKNVGEYVYSVGLNVGTPSFPNVGDAIAVSTSSPHVVFSAPVELLTVRDAITSASVAQILSTLDYSEKNVSVLMQEAPFNIIRGLNKEPETMRGVSYTWRGWGCAVVGTATGGKSQYNIFYSQTSFPPGIQQGADYLIKMDGHYSHFRVYTYINGALTNIADSRTGDITFSFPVNGIGCIITIEVTEGVTVNETIHPRIYKAQYNTSVMYENIYSHPPIFSFIDDDSGYYAPDIWGEIIEETDIRMGFACVTGMISGEVTPQKDEYRQMSIQQLRDFYNSGNEVYSHSYSHPAFYDATESKIETECMKSSVWLTSNGFFRAHDVIVYPGGLGNAKTAEQDVIRQFFAYGVDTYGSVNDEPILNPYAIKRINADTGTLAELEGYVDQAIAKNGHLVFMNHAYELNKDRTNQIQKIKNLIAYIKNNGGIILPFREAIYRIYGWK